MEATTAGQAQAAEAQTEAATEQEAQDQGVDIGEWQQSVDSRLGDAADSIREMAELVQNRLPEQQAEPEPDFAQQLEEILGGDGLSPIDPQQLQGLVSQEAKRIAQEMVGPLAQQFEQMQQKMSAGELDALQDSFPELNDPTRDRSGKTAADRLADQVVDRAEAWGVPHLANNADFVRFSHLVMKAESQAQRETPAGQGPEPYVETGGGAAPASGEGDPWDEIANAGGRKQPIW